MHEYEIGVVIPTLNSAKTLDWTLASLKGQIGCSVHTIVVDSGSDDGTLDICKRWGVETAYAPPGNMYHAINFGMRLLKTDWVTYLNSDDYVYLSSYARLIDRGEKTGADIVYGDCDYMNSEGQFLYSFKSASDKLVNIYFPSKFAQPAAIFRTKVYFRLEGFSEKDFTVSDADYFYRAWQAGMKFSRLKGYPVACFRVHSGQISSNRRLVNEERIRYFKRVGFVERLISLIPLSIWFISNLFNYTIRFLRRFYIWTNEKDDSTNLN